MKECCPRNWKRNSVGHLVSNCVVINEKRSFPPSVSSNRWEDDRFLLRGGVHLDALQVLSLDQHEALRTLPFQILWLQCSQETPASAEEQSRKAHA